MQNIANKIAFRLLDSKDFMIYSLFLEKSKFTADSKLPYAMKPVVKGGNCTFFYNPEMLENMTEEQKAFELFSSIYSILFKHPIRQNKILSENKKERKKEETLIKAASQIATQDYVFQHFKKFVGKKELNAPISEEEKESLNIESGDTFESIFRTLKEAQEGEDSENGEGEGEGEEGEGEGKPGKGKGKAPGLHSQGESEEDEEEEENEDEESDGEGEEESDSDGGNGSGNSEKEIDEFLTNISNEFEDLGGNDDDLPEEFLKQRTGRSDDSVAIEFGKKVEALPSYSKVWNKLVRWTIEKKKKEDIEFHNQWAYPNSRVAAVSPGLILPAEKMILESGRTHSFWLFLDISGSCVELAPQFFQIAKSIPRTFDVKCFLFDTNTYPFDPFKECNIRHGGGTSFRCIEERIQREMQEKKCKYPEFVVVITDGEGGEISPKHPERWSFFLAPQRCNYSRNNGHLATIRDSRGEKYLTIDSNYGSKFSNKDPKRNKKFPIAISITEFDPAYKNTKIAYEYHV